MLQSGNKDALTLLVEESIARTRLRASQNTAFIGWFTKDSVISDLIRYNPSVKYALKGLIDDYGSFGDVLMQAALRGIQVRVGEVLKRPMPQYLPEAKVRSFLTRDIGGKWYWFHTLDAPRELAKEMANAHDTIIRANAVARDVWLAVSKVPDYETFAEIPPAVVKELFATNGSGVGVAA